ncbi:MAG: cobyrinate a,c-diamide synthase, partial [Desulfovibrio sp.]|nr:cobyrinate a,c-diamide synthase [Desulfovibrio sp.]
LEAHCHVDKLLDLLGMSHCRFPRSAEPLSSGATFTHTTSETISPGTHFFAPRRSIARKVRPLVGIAWDEAFSFCYADLPALIAELGAETVFFSPLRDPAPPTGCVGLYFPGGYPELYAPALRANMSMITFLHRLAAQGMPMYGECGGYIYLMQAVTVNGVRHAMSGLLPRSCTLGKERVALGYRAARALPGWPVSGKELRQPLWVRGHEFHYALEDLGESETDGGSPFSSGAGVPLWKLHDSSGALLYDDGCRCGAVAGSWLHCYPEGSRRFWKLWLRTLLDRN